jgi:hypothetical protein
LMVDGLKFSFLPESSGKSNLKCLGADRESISPIGMKGFFEQLEMYITSKFKMTQYSGWRSQIY